MELEQLIDAMLALSGWEVLASLLGVVYVLLAAKASQWCWPLAFVSTLIYTLLFWQGQLPMQALLNFYYMAMAIYGYLVWRKHGNVEDNVAISSWSWPRQVVFLLVGTLIAILVARYLEASGNSQSPYLDAGVTVFSVLNTYLLTRKILQNWLYWVIIDAAAIVLYIQTGYYATVVMYAVYLVLAIVGYVAWLRLYRQPTN
ncbi:MAG: nicotinamide riboside transporter PnuC [Xanthomonadales bacterium]|nr:nicotinamide riboside transporter PnuC [Xanthomonadales bacterium]